MGLISRCAPRPRPPISQWPRPLAPQSVAPQLEAAKALTASNGNERIHGATGDNQTRRQALVAAQNGRGPTATSRAARRCVRATISPLPSPGAETPPGQAGIPNTWSGRWAGGRRPTQPRSPPGSTSRRATGALRQSGHVRRQRHRGLGFSHFSQFQRQQTAYPMAQHRSPAAPDCRPSAARLAKPSRSSNCICPSGVLSIATGRSAEVGRIDFPSDGGQITEHHPQMIARGKQFGQQYDGPGEL